MARTQEERDERRKRLFANELTALRQAEGHWQKAADSWGIENDGLAMMYQCRARCAESKAARCRSQQEFLDWEEDLGGKYHVRDLEEMKDRND